MIKNMKSGVCPVCDSKDVYSDIGQLKQGERKKIYVLMDRYFVDTYICANCGHLEEHISDEDFNKSIKDVITKNWKKVN